MNGIGYIFCRESAHVNLTFDIILIVCTLIDNGQSVHGKANQCVENLTVIVK